MPNHITNRIKLIGEPSEVKRVMEAVKVDNTGLGSLDFEKIIPMPADVDDSYNWCISNWGTKWNSYGYTRMLTVQTTLLRLFKRFGSMLAFLKRREPKVSTQVCLSYILWEVKRQVYSF